MPVVAAILFGFTALGAAEPEMPGDFLRVESKAWNRWLDEVIHVSWTRIRLKDVLDGEFGTADLRVEDPSALNTRVTFDADGLTRRCALWRLSRRYAFRTRWAQKEEPRVFLGLLETKRRRRSVGGILLTTMTHAMRADYREYEDLKKRGKVAQEMKVDGTIYYSTDESRDLRFENGSSAIVPVVERFKTSVPAEPPSP